MALEALLLELLDGHHPADARLGRGQRRLVHPPLVHAPEAALAQVRAGPEVLGRRAEVADAEGLEELGSGGGGRIVGRRRRAAPSLSPLNE